MNLNELVPIGSVRRNVVEYMRVEHPDLDEGGYISYKALQDYRRRYLEWIIKNEVNESARVEQAVVEALTSKDASITAPDDEGELTFGQRLADKVAEFGGSWTFILLFGAIILGWIGVNTIALMNRGFDPYPYILLNLVLSCVAALQAPIIMMSQNRQETKDRQRSEYDYKVNLKAELEIRMLHEKIDHLMIIQMQQIMEFQQLQMDYMEELNSRLEEIAIAKKPQVKDNE